MSIIFFTPHHQGGARITREEAGLLVNIFGTNGTRWIKCVGWEFSWVPKYIDIWIFTSWRHIHSVLILLEEI